MFDTSQDILNIAKTAAVIGLSVMICILTYYFIRITREIFKVVKEVSGLIDKVDDLISSIKEKVEHSTSYLLLISEGMKKVIDIAKYFSNKEKKGKK